MERIAQVAENAMHWFEYTGEHATLRNNIYILADNAPNELHDAIQAAHGTLLPDDYVYAVAYAALEAIADMSAGNDVDDVADDFANDTDVYTSELLKYIMSHSERLGRANDAIASGMADSIESAAIVAQAEERREIFYAMYRYCVQAAETTAE